MRIMILPLLAMSMLLSAVEPATSTPPKIISGQGTITVIDPVAGTIELRITDKEGRNATTLVLTLTTATKITNSGKSATPIDLKVGNVVKFSYDVRGSDVSGGTALTIDEGKKKSK